MSIRKKTTQYLTAENKCMKQPLPEVIAFNFTKAIRLFVLLLSTFLLTTKLDAQAPVDPGSIIGKVVCGYQGWFTATGDGSPINRWTHWAPGNTPQPGVAPNPNPNLTFEAYPDISLYYPTSLFQTNFGAHGDGTAAKLFSAYKEDVTDKHFQLMQQQGIDGVAFQRFIWEVLIDPAFKANRDTIAVHVRKSAEKYNRMFYLVYDLSGLGNVPGTDQARFDAIKADWTNNMLGNLQFTSSPMYAKQGGKPVVQIWGIGYNHIIGSAAIQKDLIDWFKAQGCYVIAGTPTGWRTNSGTSNANWTNTYKAANMISPWSVGAYSNQTTIDAFKTNFLVPDLAYCNTNGMAYQPVIFPGFAWSNWNGGPKNQMSRNKGEFMWRQATNLQSMGISTVEIAMFDEYDEGTAIMPMADGYDMVPTNQYFLTTSADGSYLSPDFYLRLTSKVSKMLKGIEAPTMNVTIPFSNGPTYFRTSNEADIDAQPTWVSTTDIRNNITNYGSASGNPTCAVIASNPRRGASALRVRGRDNSTSNSNVYFRVYDVNIPVDLYTTLHFWAYPENANGRFVSLDLLFTDGTYLRNIAGATDTNGVSMHPGTGRGTVGAWNKISSRIGTWCNGKTIDRIMVGYDQAANTGDFSAFIDDISINQSYFVLPVKLISFTAKQTGRDVQLQWKTATEDNLRAHEVQRSTDGINFTTIKTIQPRGGVSNLYDMTDVDPSASGTRGGKYYYRLKTTGNDNKNSFSDVEVVSFGQSTTFVLQLYPNPFKEALSVTVSAKENGRMSLLLLDAAGKTVVEKGYSVQKGISTLSLSKLRHLANGIYFLKVTMNNEAETFTIEK